MEKRERISGYRRHAAAAATFLIFTACQGESVELPRATSEQTTTTMVPETTFPQAEMTFPPSSEENTSTTLVETTTTIYQPEQKPTTTTEPPAPAPSTPPSTVVPAESPTTTHPPETTTTTQPEAEPSPERELTEKEVSEAQELLTQLLPLDSLVVDGIEGPETRRRWCLIRQLEVEADFKPMSLEPASFAELEALRNLEDITDTPGTDETLFYINTTCKMGLLAVGNKWTVVTEIAMGAPGYQQYENGGKFNVQWTRPGSQLNDGWWTSTLYPDIPEGAKGNMYRPLYFDGAIAVHGSANTDANDASHGCIRTKLEAQDKLLEAYIDARAEGRPMRVVINDGR